MSAAAPEKFFLKDYTIPDYSVQTIFLSFQLNSDITRVRQKTLYKKVNSASQILCLNGENLKLIDIQLNQGPCRYEIEPGVLKIYDTPDEFTLEITNEIQPGINRALEGLYYTNHTFSTQCEAQGFRRITYFMDRPDVLAVYTVEIQSSLPVRLSNGNCIEQNEHRVVWHDPYPKPCYLFALVAGDLGVLKDQFTTRSGRSVSLEIYSAHGTQKLCGFAMESLKKAMRWDEDRFDCEYDLDRYLIVAVDYFTAGAMENKGLNIFNSRLIFADPRMASDQDILAVESVVAHEYFHNWTGNRVTLRDWFHLSLKEGLTVFRDQEFTMDLHSRSVSRITDVLGLKEGQFVEDSGPNSHAVLPESGYSVDNFFTPTIYEKGAELIRMIQTILGRPGFKKGMDLFFQRYDGQAVTIEDFISAMSDANAFDFTQFKRWYTTPGTPKVSVREFFNPESQSIRYEISQNSSPPLHIPLELGLIDGETRTEIDLHSPHININSEGQKVFHLRDIQSRLEVQLTSSVKPVLSINRQFSAPIHLDFEQDQQQMILQIESDKDEFNRLAACQKIQIDGFLSFYSGRPWEISPEFWRALNSVLRNPAVTNDFKTLLISSPQQGTLFQQITELDGAAFKQANLQLKKAKQAHLSDYFLETYHALKNSDSKSDRELKNICLGYLSSEELVRTQLMSATNMSDEQTAFRLALEFETDFRDEAIVHFKNKWESESLVMNKWFAFQARSQHPATYTVVKQLWQHQLFDKTNPNRVYSLLGQFADNYSQFYQDQPDVYEFFFQKLIELDQINPAVASRVAGSLETWTKTTSPIKKKVAHQLKQTLNQKLSPNLYEILLRNLNSIP